MRSVKFEAIFLFFMAFVLFVTGVASQEIIGFEARFYLFAQEMWRHGLTWFPTTYQSPYPDYPVLPTLLVYRFASLCGHLCKLTAILPSAIAAAGTVSITYLLGATRNRLWGWCAALFLLLTLTFVAEARTISLDQFVTFATVLGFYCIIKNRSMVLIGVILIFSFFCRGPIGIVIPAGVMCSACLVQGEIKRFFKVGFFSLILLSLCLAVLFFMAYHVGGQPFIQDVLHMQVGSRLYDLHSPPFAFYFSESVGGYAITFPIFIALLVCLFPEFLKKSTTLEMRFLQQCIVWVLILIIGLSFAADKKMRYVLPMAPALALLCGYLFAGMYRNQRVRFLEKILKYLLLFLPVIAATFIYSYSTKLNALLVHSYLLIALCVFLQIGAWLFRRSTIMILCMSVFTFFIVNVMVVEKINFTTNVTHDFVLEIEKHRAELKSDLIFFQEGADGLPIKYLVHTPDEVKPQYILDEKRLEKLPSHTIVIVEKDNIQHIAPRILKKFHIIMSNKIGHDEVFVLERN